MLSVVLKSFVADNCKATIEWYKKRFDIMFSLIIMLAMMAMLGLILAKPKWGSFLIWPILFTYPHGWWFYHQYLPLNIGFDDLFCIFLFLVVLIRRNLLGGVRIRFGYAFWTISAFVVVAAVANIAGSRGAPSFERVLYIKDILKLGVYWCLFYAIIHCIDDERDLKMQLTMFSIAAVLGATIVILQYFFHYQMEIFAAPITLGGKSPIGFRGRTAGAFMNQNTAACVLACCSMLIITAMRLQKTITSKIVTYAFIFVLLTGMIVTRSRAGLMAFSGAIILMAFFGQGKKFAWFVIIAAIVVGITFLDISRDYLERWRVAYDPSTGVVGKNVAGRFATWRGYFETATARDYLLGQGFRQGIAKNGMESHSTYVSLITVYGIGGVIWAMVALVIFFRKALRLRHFPDSFISAISAGCIWALIVWGIYAMAADALNAAYSRYLLFYLVVLIDRAYSIAGQQQELLSYDEEVEEMEYASVERC